jgi:hypothetical protein
MYWLMIAAILVIGWVLALVGILYVARDLMQVVDETPRPLPPANRSNAVNMLGDLESS